MGMTCTICRRESAGAIDALLRTGRSVRSVAAEFGVGYDALARHARNHLARRLPVALVSPEPDAGQDPLAELIAVLRERALRGSDSAARELRLAYAAQAVARHAIAPTRALEDELEWRELRSKMLAALEPYPEARLAIADALA